MPVKFIAKNPLISPRQFNRTDVGLQCNNMANFRDPVQKYGTMNGVLMAEFRQPG